MRSAATHDDRKSLSRLSAEHSLIDRLRSEGVRVSLRAEKVGNFRINYVSAGEGSPLLLIHGANFGWGQWAPNIKALAERFKVIAVDLPGCGGSTPVDFDSIGLNGYVEAVAGLAKKLSINSFGVVGHSFGSVIAIKLAERNDLTVTRLVLTGPFGFTRNVPGRQKLVTFGPLARFLSKTAVAPNRSSLRKFLTDSVVRKNSISPELVDYYYAAVRENKSNHPLLFMHSLTQPFRLKPELLLTEEFISTRCPVLTIIGEEDRLMPVAAIKKATSRHPNASLQIFPDTGHVPGLERPAQFNRALVNFLK